MSKLRNFRFCPKPTPRLELASINIEFLDPKTDDDLYAIIKAWLEGRGYPLSMKGNKGKKANFRRFYSKFSIVDDKLYVGSKEVLRQSTMKQPIESIHGRFNKKQHFVGFRRLDTQLKQKYHYVGFKRLIQPFCERNCIQCQLSRGIVWFRVKIAKFKSPTLEMSSTLCDRLNVKRGIMPNVQEKCNFRSPATVEAIEGDGNCLFRALLRGIGAVSTDHQKLRARVFNHMEKTDVIEKLKIIYKESFDECLRHRSTEKSNDSNVCAIVIHAAASLLGIDVLVHWKAEDGRLEWFLCLASLVKNVWADYQIALRFINDHVDLVLSFT